MIQCQALQCRAFNCRQLCLSSLRHTWASDFGLLRTLNHKTFEKTLSFNCAVKLIYHIHIWNITHDIYIYIYIIDERTQFNTSPLNHDKLQKSPKKVNLASLSSPTIRISLCCEQSMWEILLLYSSHRLAMRPHASTIWINSYNIYSTMIRTSNNHGGRHVCKNVLPGTSTLKQPHHLRSYTWASDFRVSPNIKPQNLWNAFV